MKKFFISVVLLATVSVQPIMAAAATVMAPPLQKVVTAPQKTTTQDAASCASNSGITIAVDPPPNVDMKKVRDTWLDWYNKARAQNGLAPYAYNESLNMTAGNWSFFSKKKGYIDHKRAGQSSYYDYRKIGAWFASKGVTFADGNGRSNYVENIGWDYYSCPDSTVDCTEKLIASIRKTYNFFMSEKGKKYRAHYDSIMNGNYKKIGLGIAVDPAKKRYYLTVHYATDVVTENETAQNTAACEVPGNGKF